eukprot:scaffold2726_cov167-Amphora_coffeaeformis.AAC.19
MLSRRPPTPRELWGTTQHTSLPLYIVSDIFLFIPHHDYKKGLHSYWRIRHTELERKELSTCTKSKMDLRELAALGTHTQNIVEVVVYFHNLLGHITDSLISINPKVW